jgi:riboflavin synthase
MFTGIVEETGAVKAFEKGAAGARLEIAASAILSDLQLGGSIAVNGCCLTAVAISESGFFADLSPETLSKTNLGDLAAGARVNLERPLLPSSRLSGHFVQGHVDGTGELLGIDPVGDDNWKLRVRAPRDLLHYLVYKGSVAIDGISLTIADLVDDVIEVAIIPHTFQETNLSGRKPGDRVNLEIDILAKYVARQLEARA